MARQIDFKSNTVLEKANNGLAAGSTIAFGDLVQANTSGFIEQATDIASKTVLGVAMEAVDNSGGIDGAETITISTNIITTINTSGLAVANLYTAIYIKDEVTVQAIGDATNNNKAGILISIDTVNDLGEIMITIEI